MTKQQASALKPTDILVTATGGFLNLVSSDGELLAEIPVPVGRHLASHFLDLVRPGQYLEVGEGLVPFEAKSRWAVTSYPDDVNRQSDANPHFQPTYATEAERRLRVLLYRKREESTRTERRAAAQGSLETMRKQAEEKAEADKAEAAAAAEALAAERAAQVDALAQAIAKAQAVVE
jgi:hypothetical protein